MNAVHSSTSLVTVIGLAFDDASGFAFGQAARLAHHVPHPAFHLVHVFEKGPLEPPASNILVGNLRRYAQEKIASIGGLDRGVVAIHLRHGDVAQQLVQLASDVAADVIVIGAHKGPHMKSWLVGSTAERLMASSSVPVFVAGPPARVPPQEPAIEPPCPTCLEARFRSSGAQWWCERHGEHARRNHVYSYQRALPLAATDPLSAGAREGEDFSGAE